MEHIFVLMVLAISLLHAFTMGHVIYKIFKLRTKFNTMWIWIVWFVPVFGPLFYFTGKKER
jgi:hypothetical protein